MMGVWNDHYSSSCQVFVVDKETSSHRKSTLEYLLANYVGYLLLLNSNIKYPGVPTPVLTDVEK